MQWRKRDRTNSAEWGSNREKEVFEGRHAVAEEGRNKSSGPNSAGNLNETGFSSPEEMFLSCTSTFTISISIAIYDHKRDSARRLSSHSGSSYSMTEPFSPLSIAAKLS